MTPRPNFKASADTLPTSRPPMTAPMTEPSPIAAKVSAQADGEIESHAGHDQDNRGCREQRKRTSREEALDDQRDADDEQEAQDHPLLPGVAEQIDF